MGMIGRHRQHREQAQRARDRFERRLGRMRREVNDVSSRTRTQLRERAPSLLPWVFSLGFLVGLWRPLTLGTLFRGSRQVGRIGHLLTAGAGAVMHSSIGREALAAAERVVREAAAPTGARTADSQNAEPGGTEAAPAPPDLAPASSPDEPTSLPETDDKAAQVPPRQLH